MVISILAFILIPIVFNKKIGIKNFPVLIIPAFFFLYMFSTILWANNQTLAIVRGIGIIFLAFSFTILQIYSKTINLNSINFKKVENFIFLYIALTFIYYFIGLYFYNYSPLGEERGLFGLYVETPLLRLRGFVNSPNNLILILLPMFFYSYMIAQSKSKILYISLITLVLLTFSGAGYSVLICILSTFLVLGNKNLVVNLCILGSIVIYLTYTIYNSSPELARMIDIRLLRFATASGRFDLYSKTFELSLGSPYWGHGLAQVREYLANYQGVTLQSSHNSFLEVFFEGGIIGLMLFFFSWIVLIIKVIKSKIKIHDKFIFFLYIACLLILSFINLMVYVELMVLNLFVLIFLINLKEQEKI